MTRWPAHRIARLGMVHVPEGRAIFSSLSVEENLPCRSAAGWGARARPKRWRAPTRRFPVLAERRRQLGGTLSGGQQRILSLAKVLAVPPKLLIVDELSLGLAPVIVDQVYDGLVAIHQQGCALLVVEQQVDRVLAIADRAVLLVKGAVAWEGPARDARATLESPACSGARRRTGRRRRRRTGRSRRIGLRRHTSSGGPRLAPAVPPRPASASPPPPADRRRPGAGAGRPPAGAVTVGRRTRRHQPSGRTCGWSGPNPPSSN